MKKILWKKENLLYVFMFLFLVVVHFPLLSKNILTADVLLNNSFYNGYSWEISLGRFGLFVVGISKSYLSAPYLDTFLSFVLIVGITYLLIKLFEIDSKISKILLVFIMVLSPIVSATLLFHYCSIAYFAAFLSGIFSIYLYYHTKNKYLKYLGPIIFMVISLSMYQAYLSLIVTTFVFYQLKLLLDEKINYKDTGIFVLLLFCSVLLYFIGMKLSLLVFHIDMASYSNADSIGFSTLLQFPNKIVDSYQLFYQMFFTNEIMKNTFLWNHYFHLGILISFLLTFGYRLYSSKLKPKEIILAYLCILLLPVFLNSVIFVINDSKLQLLMSASYLLIFVFFLSILDQKILKGISTIFLILLIRNYFIQNQASYMTLENTYSHYDTIIRGAIYNHMNELDKPFLVVGDIPIQDTEIRNRNYGYVTDYGIFWEEYHLRKLGFERFCFQNYGLSLTFGDEELYQELFDGSSSEDLIYEYKDTIVINLSKSLS